MALMVVLLLVPWAALAGQSDGKRPADWFRVSGMVSPSLLMGGRVSVAELFFNEGFAWTIFQGAFVSDFGPCEDVGESGRFLIAATTEPSFRFVDTGRHFLSLGLMLGFGQSYGCHRNGADCTGDGSWCGTSATKDFSGTLGMYFSPVLRYRLYVGRVGFEASAELPLVLGMPIDSGKGAWFDWPILGMGIGL